MTVVSFLGFSGTSIADRGHHNNDSVKLTKSDCKEIVAQAVAGALEEKSDFRAGGDDNPQMQIYCMDTSGKILAQENMDDAWIGSIDIAKAKAYTAMAFSTNENALTSRTIGIASQPNGPLWQIGSSNRPGTNGKEHIKEHGIIEFPGGVPLYKGGELVGGLGVSGDSVRADEAVAVCGSAGFEAPIAIRSDTVLGIDYTTSPCPLTSID